MNKKAFWFVVIVLILFIGYTKISKKAPNTQDSPFGSGDFEFTFKHDGLERRYLIHVPDSYNLNISTPLILAFHGGAGNADNAPDFFEMEKLSDSEGFIIAYPEATGKKFLGNFMGVWNAGKCCADAVKNNVDDVGYTNRLIEDIKAKYSVDDKRIYAVGFSNGAQMVYRLACEKSDLFAAIATGGAVGNYDICNPSNPVPIFTFHAINDPCSPIEGAEECGACLYILLENLGLSYNKSTYSCDSVENYLNKWKELDGCSENSQIVYQNKNTTCNAYSDCNDNSEIISCLISQGGHAWPGRTTYSIGACERNPNGKICAAWKETVGPLIPDSDIKNLIWEFFEKYQK